MRVRKIKVLSPYGEDVPTAVSRRLARRVSEMPCFDHRFCGKIYKVGAGLGGGNIGAAMPRETPRKYRFLGVHPCLRGCLLIQCLVHESLHACFGDALSEKQVTRAGLDIGALLWRYGYRLPSPKKGRK